MKEHIQYANKRKRMLKGKLKEELWEKHQFTLMCGLSVEDINKQGAQTVIQDLSKLVIDNCDAVIARKYMIKRKIGYENLLESKVRWGGKIFY